MTERFGLESGSTRGGEMAPSTICCSHCLYNLSLESALCTLVKGPLSLSRMEEDTAREGEASVIVRECGAEQNVIKMGKDVQSTVVTVLVISNSCQLQLPELAAPIA